MRNNALEEGQRWLSQAAEDPHWAKHLAEEGGWHLACFLAQQVAEKAIKAFLYAQGEEIVLGHSVARLCADAARYQPGFADKARRWSLLDGYYYPHTLSERATGRHPGRGLHAGCGLGSGGLGRRGRSLGGAVAGS
jgi:HEPN domain-containing protein